GDRPGRRSGREMGLGFFRGDLNLSDEQKTQVQEKSREFQLATEETRLKLRFAQQDLRMAMQQEPVDQAKIDSLWADIAGLRQVQDEARVEQLLELKSLLTDEQLASLQVRENAKQELQTLKAEFHGMLLTSGEIDAAKLQELQAEITEKEMVLEKERAEKRAARQDDFTKHHGRRKMSKAVKE
ncbi:MAG: periplasmic heavy metal sensor, partial [bacterium]|nr:periplasmic heavy metal sensor [bacterium]